MDVNHQLTLLGARYKNEPYTITALIPETSESAALLPQDIIEHRNLYVQLPDTLPTRVAELAATITEPVDSPYEKALLLEAYLRNNHTYDLSVDYLPAGKDFVDYFLFEQQKGYCTYFASSLSILLRKLDIPTRYVEGFRMPNTATNGLYEVAFADGHAWVEAYFDGRGWIILEPTPGANVLNLPKDMAIATDYSAIDLYDIENERAYLTQMKTELQGDREF